MISDENREEKQLTMLESAGKRTSWLPVMNDMASYGKVGGTKLQKGEIEIGTWSLSHNGLDQSYYSYYIVALKFS